MMNAMFSEIYSIMSLLVNMFVPLSQEKLLKRSVKTPSHLKMLISIAWHNYKYLHERNGRSSEIVDQALPSSECFLELSSTVHFVIL